MPAVTSEQMREVDRVAIEETGPNLFQMMENAGRSLAAVVLERAGGSPNVVVLAGSGGNGGGGICASRHLANRGVPVTVVVTDPDRLDGVPATQLGVFRSTPGSEARPDAIAALRPTLIVDAIIGYGLSGPPSGVSAQLIEWAAGSPVEVVSLDVPSGIDATTGEAPGAHVVADVTLTLDLSKTGLDVAAVGRLLLADIGIPVEAHRRADVEVPSGVFGSRWVVELE